MKLSDVVEKWEIFLKERFGVVCLCYHSLPTQPSVMWSYPSVTCRLSDGVTYFGVVFSDVDSKDATVGIIERHGYMAIGGSKSGSMLIVKILGTDSELGSCKWIAPGFEYYPESDFHLITSRMLADPASVFSEFIDNKYEYGDDTTFGS